MKGFAKVFFLVTMLFAVTSLFASVSRSGTLEKSKCPPGYSLSIEQAPLLAVPADIVVAASKWSNSTTLSLGSYDAKGVSAITIKPEIVIAERFNRTLADSNINAYIKTETEQITISEAEALPDKAY